jgi:hypothetical protein
VRHDFYVRVAADGHSPVIDRVRECPQKGAHCGMEAVIVLGGSNSMSFGCCAELRGGNRSSVNTSRGTTNRVTPVAICFFMLVLWFKTVRVLFAARLLADSGRPEPFR